MTTVSGVNLENSTAVTPSNPADSSTAVPNTAWVQALFTSSYSPLQNGYVKLPNGLIFQWGIGSTEGPGTRNTPVSFPISFPTQCFVVLISAQWNTSQNSSLAQVEAGSITTSGFSFGVASAGSVNGATAPSWIAIGR